MTTSYVNGVTIDSKLARIDRDPVGQVPGYPPADLAWHYYHYDALGSVVSVTGGGATGNDPTGPTENQYHTNAWGEDLRKLEVLPGEFVDLVEHGWANILTDRYGFTGRERDEETRLMHYRRRTYDPRTARFVQKDPSGMPEGPNRYTYVRNSPVNAVDPWGLEIKVLYDESLFTKEEVENATASRRRLNEQLAGKDERIDVEQQDGTVYAKTTKILGSKDLEGKFKVTYSSLGKTKEEGMKNLRTVLESAKKGDHIIIQTHGVAGDQGRPAEGLVIGNTPAKFEELHTLFGEFKEKGLATIQLQDCRMKKEDVEQLGKALGVSKAYYSDVDMLINPGVIGLKTQKGFLKQTKEIVDYENKTIVLEYELDAEKIYYNPTEVEWSTGGEKHYVKEVVLQPQEGTPKEPPDDKDNKAK